MTDRLQQATTPGTLVMVSGEGRQEYVVRKISVSTTGSVSVHLYGPEGRERGRHRAVRPEAIKAYRAEEAKRWTWLRDDDMEENDD